MKWTSRIILLTAASALALLPMGAASAQQAAVSANDNEFDPTEIEVESGTTITWTNNGDLPHTVTAVNGSFESGTMEPGDTFETTFNAAGQYSYYCEFHGDADGGGMAGVVTVTGEGDEDPTDDPNDDNGGTGGNNDTLPMTGVDVGAFLYLAAAMIGVGSLLLRLERPSYSTQSRVK